MATSGSMKIALTKPMAFALRQWLVLFINLLSAIQTLSYPLESAKKRDSSFCCLYTDAISLGGI